jgi:hypothetical protein
MQQRASHHNHKHLHAQGLCLTTRTLSIKNPSPAQGS